MPIAMAYGAPQEDPAQRSTMLQKMADSETGFVLHAFDRLTTIIDVSKLNLPPNAQFRYARLSVGKEVEHDSFELLGTESLMPREGL